MYLGHFSRNAWGHAATGGSYDVALGDSAARQLVVEARGRAIGDALDESSFFKLSAVSSLEVFTELVKITGALKPLQDFLPLTKFPSRTAIMNLSLIHI